MTAADKPVADPLPADVRAILAVPADQRTPEQIDRVFSYWRTTVPEWQEENRRIESLWQSHPRGTTQLVLQERDEPRQTHRLERGNFLAPAEEVSPGVPDFLHPLATAGDSKATPTRLDFARWLADRRSPTDRPFDRQPHLASVISAPDSWRRLKTWARRASRPRIQSCWTGSPSN